MFVSGQVKIWNWSTCSAGLIASLAGFAGRFPGKCLRDLEVGIIGWVWRKVGGEGLHDS